MLRIRGLTRLHLGPLDLDVAAGTCVALSGPSGAGKSMLLRAVADLDPAEGSVSLDGVEREALLAPDWRRRVGYLAAEPGWWAATVAEHFPGPALEAATPWFRRLTLGGQAAHWKIAHLSSGERQRLALIRLLVQAPRALLLDEPTAALDPANRDIVEAVLRERREAGAMLLVVTHDAAQADRLAADRRLVLEAGRLREADR